MQFGSYSREHTVYEMFHDASQLLHFGRTRYARTLLQQLEGGLIVKHTSKVKQFGALEGRVSSVAGSDLNSIRVGLESERAVATRYLVCRVRTRDRFQQAKRSNTRSSYTSISVASLLNQIRGCHVIACAPIHWLRGLT